MRRAHVDPQAAARRAAGIGCRMPLGLEVALCRLGRHIDAGAADVELPAVIDAAQARLLVAAEEQRGATMRTGLLHETHRARAVAEGYEVFAEHAQTHRRAVRRRQLVRQHHGQPEATEHLTHRRAGSHLGQKRVVVFTKHASPPSRSPPDLYAWGIYL